MAPLWKAAVFSAKETPFPLIVSATITVGPPLFAAASSRTSRIAPTSWPSTLNTFHPNARHFSSMLGMSKISFVGPVAWIRFRSMMAVMESNL